MSFFDIPQPITLRADSTAPAGAMQVFLRFAAEKPTPQDPGSGVGEITFLAPNTMIVSLGKKEKVNADTLRQAGGSLARWLLAKNVKEAAVDTNAADLSGLSGHLEALLEGCLLGSYRFIRYKKADDAPATCAITFTAPTLPALEKSIARVEILTRSVNLAREWAHEPANVVNPTSLEERARELAAKYQLKITVLDDQQLTELGAEGIVAVGKGSKTPSKLMILEYPGKKPAGEKPVVLVGKALTFDSGGYSIKTVEGIQGMKYDKCGGVTVLATLMAAAELGIEHPIIGVVAAAENMISANAYRPDDILKMLSGKTVEIITTDAEGRLVLADALTYTQRNYPSRVIIDLATLTGGVVVALGRARGAVLSNNDELADALFRSGERTAEKLWRMPLDEDYSKLIKSDDADIKNAGGREGHCSIGGAFLKEFIEEGTVWAHLDIAGVADLPKETPYCAKGATGFGVRLLVDYLENLK